MTFFVFSLIACLLSMNAIGGFSFHSLTAPVFTAFVFGGLTSLLPKVPRIIMQLILGEAIILLCLADCYCQEFFGSAINSQLLSVIVNTDAREMGEFLSNFVGIGLFKHWRLALLVLLVVLFPVSYLTKIQAFFQKKLRIGKFHRIGFAVIIAVCILLEINQLCKYFQCFNPKSNIQGVENLMFRQSIQYMQTPVHRLIFADFTLKRVKATYRDLKDCTMLAEVDSCSHVSPHIVLVIGESYNKHHSSLYGYPLETTPLQQKREKNGELFVFRDVVSPWNITSNAFFEIFSRPLFPMLLRRSGYSVSFFSNQFAFKGLSNRHGNKVGNFFLDDRRLSDTLFDYRNARCNRYDMMLVRQLADYRKENEAEYSFDIVHLIGQHFEYEKRYPANETHFAVNEYDYRDISDEARQIVMHYDNATFYNDKVLDSIIRIYEGKDAVLLFVSDHGEEVYDNEQVSGRLFQQPTFAEAHNEYEVPMWIWCSERYRMNHPEIVAQIVKSLDKPFITSDLSQILLYLSGISCRWTESSRNLLSDDYECKTRIISGDIDYDKLK